MPDRKRSRRDRSSDMDLHRGERSPGQDETGGVAEARHDRYQDEDAEPNRCPTSPSGPGQAAARDHRLPGQQKQNRDTTGRVDDQGESCRRGAERKREPAGEKRDCKQSEQGDVGLRSELDRAVATRPHRLRLICSRGKQGRCQAQLEMKLVVS